jgi:hypothetical protein
MAVGEAVSSSHAGKEIAIKSREGTGGDIRTGRQIEWIPETCHCTSQKHIGYSRSPKSCGLNPEKGEPGATRPEGDI